MLSFFLIMSFFSWLDSICTTSVSVVTQVEVGAPGVVVGVSVDGSIVWCEGEFLLDSLYSPGHQYCCLLHFMFITKSQESKIAIQYYQ